MPLSRELSQLASVITVKDSNKHVGIGSTTPTSEFDVAGNIKATSFYGDGSNLTGITAEGTGAIGGLTIKDQSGSVVGTGGSISTIDFSGSSGVTVSATSGSAGIATVIVSAEVVSDTTPQLGGNLDLNSKTVTGTGSINITGNVTATSFSGDGSNLTGIDTTVSESEVTAHQAALSITESQISDLGNYATVSYVNSEVAGIVSASPAALDTLNELAAALGDDANFSTTVTNSIATKASLSGANFTGVVTATSFSGDGSSLTGVVSETLEVFVRSKDAGNVVGRSGNVPLRPVAITVTSNTIDIVPRSGSDITVTV